MRSIRSLTKQLHIMAYHCPVGRYAVSEMYVDNLLLFLLRYSRKRFIWDYSLMLFYTNVGLEEIET